jgi:hypothetical protein
MLFDLDLDLVLERETSRKRPKTERGRSVAAGALRSVSLISALTVCKAAGVMGREGGFDGVVVVAFSVVLVMVEAEAWCEAVLLAMFFDEEESTEVAKAGAMTRGEETEEEEEP